MGYGKLGILGYAATWLFVCRRYLSTTGIWIYFHQNFYFAEQPACANVSNGFSNFCRGPKKIKDSPEQGTNNYCLNSNITKTMNNIYSYLFKFNRPLSRVMDTEKCTTTDHHLILLSLLSPDLKITILSLSTLGLRRLGQIYSLFNNQFLLS